MRVKRVAISLKQTLRAAKHRSQCEILSQHDWRSLGGFVNIIRPSVILPFLLGIAGCSTLNDRAEGHGLAKVSATDCVGDLEFAAAFLLENDAGIQAAGWTAYPREVSNALNRSRASAAHVESPAECVDLIRQFMASIRRGHLSANLLVTDTGEVADIGAVLRQSPKVMTRRLSEHTSYIEAPSFMGDAGQQLARIVDDNQDGVREARYLVIDLRRNGGGSDSAFLPLLSLLGPATYRSHYPYLFVTPANIAATEALIPEISPHPDVELLKELIARMKAAGMGWLAMADQQVLEVQLDASQVKATPERVVLLIGDDCASSCEQFVITARQNPRVTLIGRKTFGALDASNCRLMPAPSGQIAVYYATTYVRRPAGQQIDEIGIPPDIELPAPADEEAFLAEVALAQAAVEQNKTD